MEPTTDKTTSISTQVIDTYSIDQFDSLETLKNSLQENLKELTTKFLNLKEELKNSKKNQLELLISTEKGVSKLIQKLKDKDNQILEKDKKIEELEALIQTKNRVISNKDFEIDRKEKVLSKVFNNGQRNFNYKNKYY